MPASPCDLHGAPSPGLDVVVCPECAEPIRCAACDRARVHAEGDLCQLCLDWESTARFERTAPPPPWTPAEERWADAMQSTAEWIDAVDGAYERNQRRLGRNPE